MERRPTTTKAYQAGVEHRGAYGYREAPLSGEWGGESIPELSEQYGIDLFDTDNGDLFEQGFYSVNCPATDAAAAT